MPPLRERKDDILMLVEYFVQRYAKKAGKSIRTIEKSTLERLQAYDWPGNIRELQNVIERSVILSSGDVFAVDDVWLSNESSPVTSRVATPALRCGTSASRGLSERLLRPRWPQAEAASPGRPELLPSFRFRPRRWNTRSEP